MQSLSVLVYHQHTQIVLHPYVADSVIEMSVFQGMKSFLIGQSGKENGNLKITYLRDTESNGGGQGGVGKGIENIEFCIRNSGIPD